MSDGSACLNPLEARQHAIDDFDGVGAGLLADRERNRVFAVETSLTARFLDGVGDARDVADTDDRAFLVRENDVLEFPDAAQAPHRAHGDFRRAGDERPAGDFGVLPVDG